MQMKKSSLSTLSNEALCKLRDEIAALLSSRAEELQKELNRLTAGAMSHRAETNGRAIVSKAKRKRVAPKYRGPAGETWCGRGKKPRWLAGALNEGKNLEDFLIVPAETGSGNSHRE